MNEAQPECPDKVWEYARQALDYVESTLNFKLDFTAETLPVLDHYLRSIPDDQDELRSLVAFTSGAYFGEVIRGHLGGRWLIQSAPETWRLVLPTGVTFSPAGVALEAITHKDEDKIPVSFYFPEPLQVHIEGILGRMGELSEENYYSLSGRFDTLEHIEEVLIAILAKARADKEKAEQQEKQ